MVISFYWIVLPFTQNFLRSQKIREYFNFTPYEFKMNAYNFALTETLYIFLFEIFYFLFSDSISSIILIK